MSAFADILRKELAAWVAPAELAVAVAGVERVLLTAPAEALAELVENRIRFSVARADTQDCASMATACRRVGRLASPLAKRNRAEYHRAYMAQRRAKQKEAQA